MTCPATAAREACTPSPARGRRLGTAWPCLPEATSTRAASTSHSRDGTTGTELCKGTATYHENPRHLAAINACSMHEQVTAGHDFTVTARYDNSEPLSDVMGIYLTYVWWGTQ